MKLKCAIFDFDGTLFDSMFIWDSAGEVYLRSLGVEPKPTLREEVRAMSLHQSACHFRQEYAIPFSVEAIMEGINRTVEEFYLHTIQPKPGAAAFLKQLNAQGVRMCIATASERSPIEAALKRCGMEEYFEAIFTCSNVGHGKDEPVIFRRAMAHFGADRSNTVIFEDALHALQTAWADGFTVAAVYDPSEERQAQIRHLSDCFIPDFEHTEDFWRMVHEDENSVVHRRK